MTLYYIDAESEDCEDLSQFVRAKTPHDAVQFWFTAGLGADHEAFMLSRVVVHLAPNLQGDGDGPIDWPKGRDGKSIFRS